MWKKKRIKKEGSGYEKNLNQEPKKDIYIYIMVWKERANRAK